jgi:hypothetical protein
MGWLCDHAQTLNSGSKPRQQLNFNKEALSSTLARKIGLSSHSFHSGTGLQERKPHGRHLMTG